MARGPDHLLAANRRGEDPHRPAAPEVLAHGPAAAAAVAQQSHQGHVGQEEERRGKHNIQAAPPAKACTKAGKGSSQCLAPASDLPQRRSPP